MSTKTVRIHYSPFPAQVAFHQGTELLKCYSGGWGAGKTYAGAREALKLAVLNEGADGFVGAPTYSMLNRVTLREFLKALPKEIIKREVKGDRYIELVHGGRIWYGSTDRPYTLEGTNLAWFWLDEARFCSRDAFDVLNGRLRSPQATRRQGVLSTTPSYGWLHEEFCSGKANRGLYIGKTTENTVLPEAFIDNLKETLSPQAFKMYALGEFVTLSGGVFEDFTTEDNCEDLAYDPAFPMDIAVDFGYRSSAVLFCQTIPRCGVHQCEQCVHVIAEMMPENTSTLALGQQIHAALLRYGWKGNTCYIDPAGQAKGVQFGISDVNILESQGFSCCWTMAAQDRSIRNGIELMRSKIRSLSGKRSMFFNNSLIGSKRGIVSSLQKTVYPEKTTVGKNPDEPVKDGVYDHARDALRYYLVNKFPVSSYLQGIM